MTLRDLLKLSMTVQQRRDEAAEKVQRHDKRLEELAKEIEAKRADMRKELEE